MSKFCTNCGAQLPDSAKFCENCGARVADSAAQQPGQQAYQQPTAQAGYYQQPAQPQYQQPAQPQYQQPAQPQYQQPAQSQYQQPAQPQYQQPAQPQYQQPAQPQYQQPAQPQYQQPASAPQKEAGKKRGVPVAVIGVAAAVIIAGGIFAVKSVMDKNEPYSPSYDSRYVSVDEQPGGSGQPSTGGAGAGNPSAGGGATAPFPGTSGTDDAPPASVGSAPLPELPPEPPESYWSASWGPVIVVYPKDYEEDLYDDEFYATHPGYPDTIDMLMLKHGTYTPGEEEIVVSNYQWDYDSIYDESVLEGSEYSVYTFTGEQSIDDDISYRGIHYVIFRDPDFFVVCVLTDGKDNRLGDPGDWLAFQPDVPWLD